MTLSYTYNGAALTHKIQPSAINIPSRAENGDPGMGGIPVEDPGATLAIVGHKPFYVEESACAQPRLWTGWTTQRDMGRSLDRGMFVDGDARLVDVTIVDLNAALNFRLITGTDGNRPSETWNDRIAWLLASDYLTGLVENDTTFVDSRTIVMNAADYRDQTPAAVLQDLDDRTGNVLNFFLFWDPTDSDVKLFMKRTVETTYTSTLAISNDEADVDNSVTFYPNTEATLARQPDTTYSGVVVNYTGGRIYRRRPSSETAFIQRETTISRPYTKSATTASEQADGWLDEHSGEADRITVTIRVPKESAGLATAGQRIYAKFTHLPTYQAGAWLRIVTCTPKPVDDVADQYDLALELTGARLAGSGGETCECEEGDTGVLSTGTLTLSDRLTLHGPIYVPAYCTLTIDSYAWSPYTDPTWHPQRIRCRWQDESDNYPPGSPLSVALGADLGYEFNDASGNGFNADIGRGVAMATATWDTGGAVSGEVFENPTAAPVPIYLSVGIDPTFEASGTWSVTVNYHCGASEEDEEIVLPPDPANQLDNTSATTDPTVDDDADDGYSVGSTWVNTASGDVFVLVDSTVGAAVWVLTTGGGTGFVTVIDGGKETVSTVAASGATETLDLGDGNVHDLTLTADCTLTFAGATAGVACSFTLLLRQDGTGGWDTTWPGSVVWAGGTAPTLDTTASTVSVLTFFTLDGGTVWYGFPTGGGGGTPGDTVEDETTWGVTPDAGAADEYSRADHTHGTPAQPATGTGPILISDAPSTPLVFADLIQNEAQTDLVYADP